MSTSPEGVPSAGVSPHRAQSQPGATEVWLKMSQAAQYAGVGRKQLYKAVETRHLRAAKVGGRGDLRFRREWIDAWMESLAPTVHT